VEITVALVLLGIVCAVAAGRNLFPGTLEQQAEVEKLKAHIRYVQALAIGSDVHSRIRIDGTSYRAERLTTPPTKVLLPGEDQSPVPFTTITVTTGSFIEVVFDAFGDPGDSDILLDTSGPMDITVTKHTGYVP
jgi:hypothetical protein